MSDPTPPDRLPTPGLTPGDPLGGLGAPSAPSAPSAPEPPAYPPGYTSPPPPGSSGGFGTPSPAPPFAPGTFRLSGWWRRVGAALIDGIIITAIASIVLVPLGIGAATVDSDTGIAALIGALILTTLILVIVGFLYAPYMMARTNGRTIGRMATGIRVIRAGGEPMTFGFAVLREIVVKGLVVGIVSSATFGLAGLLDVLWPLWDEQKRALHDMVVNTRTVRA